MKKIIIAALTVAITGCASNQKYDGFPEHLAISYLSKESIAIGVQDRRPYVINHDKDEDFTGLYRGNFGIPISIPTISGETLADDMAKALKTSLSSGNVIKISPQSTKLDAIRALQSSHSKNILLLTINEWKFDTFRNARLFYDIEMEVIDNAGKVVINKKDVGNDDVGGSYMFPIVHAREAMQSAFKQKIESLYNGEISQALNDNSGKL